MQYLRNSEVHAIRIIVVEPKRIVTIRRDILDEKVHEFKIEVAHQSGYGEM
jgi:hypothetical protein